jgi:hypothetical protein
MSAVTSDDENANGISHYSKEKMIRKTMKVHSPNIAFANREGFGSGSGCRHEMPQLCIEFIREIRCSDFLVISHDLVEYPNKPSDEGPAASASATAFDPFGEFFE